MRNGDETSNKHLDGFHQERLKLKRQTLNPISKSIRVSHVDKVDAWSFEVDATGSACSPFFFLFRQAFRHSADHKEILLAGIATLRVSFTTV